MTAPGPRLRSDAPTASAGPLAEDPVRDRIREGIDHLRRQGLRLLHVELTPSDLNALTSPHARRARRYRFQGLEVKPLINVPQSVVVAGYPNRSGRVRYLF